MDAHSFVYLDATLALLALMNPVSKMFIVTTFPSDFTPGRIRRIAVKSSLIAIFILLSFTLIGHFLLNMIFHVRIYAFKIAGGLVLVHRGFLALNKGLFFERDKRMEYDEMSIVPIASPMIAGPATIAASVSFPAKYGYGATITAIVLSALVTLVVMLSARVIGSQLIRHNLMGALIRITGLIVATIGIQMLCDGVADYIVQIL